MLKVDRHLFDSQHMEHVDLGQHVRLNADPIERTTVIAARVGVNPEGKVSWAQ